MVWFILSIIAVIWVAVGIYIYKKTRFFNDTSINELLWLILLWPFIALYVGWLYLTK